MWLRLVRMTGFIAAVTLSSTAQTAPAANSILADKRVTFVIDTTGPDAKVDRLIVAHLESLGASVTVIDDSHSRLAIAGQDLVVFSSTADARLLDGQLRDARVPMLTWNNGSLPRLGLTGPTVGEDFGLTEPDTYLAMTNAPHPMGAGLPAGNLVGNASNNPRSWGKPGVAAQVIATQPGYPERAAIFAYEQGTLLADERPAPARRVSFFFQHKTFDGIEAVAEGRQAKGLPLFDAALQWAVAHPAAPAMETRSANGKRLAYVTLPKSPHRDPKVRAAVDRTNAFLLKRFAEAGFKTTVIDEDAGVRDIQNFDVMVIGATVRANRVLGTYKDVPIPVLLLENDILDDMNMTARKRHIDFGEIEEGAPVTLVNPTHPVAAGVPAGPLPLFRTATLMGYGLPGPGAIVVAATDKRKGVIFSYEKGATMADNVVAPARRIYFPIDFQGVENLTEAGLRIFDSALMWSAGDY